MESGADCVETNLSCPNVSTCDGQLYQNPDDARVIASRVRDAIGRTPYLVKIGHLTSHSAATSLIEALEPWIDGIAMTNSVATVVTSEASSSLNAGGYVQPKSVINLSRSRDQDVPRIDRACWKKCEWVFGLAVG